MQRLLLVIFFLVSIITIGQVDSVPYSKDYEFVEGIYLTMDQFRQNKPITRDKIMTTGPKNQLDFFTQVVEQKYIIVKDSSGKEQKLTSASIWGYCQNRTIYLNFNDRFNRLNVIGSFFHFTSVVRTSAPGFQDPMNINYGMTTSYDELRQFVFDTKTDKIFDFNVRNMEALLMRDTELYNQFMALKKREKSDAIFIYLRKYNEKYPLYLRQ